MPLQAIFTMAKRHGKTKSEAEKIWKEAKHSAKSGGRLESDDDFYPYVMGIFKRMIGETGEHTASADALPNDVGLYYLQPDGTWDQNGDSRSDGKTREEVLKMGGNFSLAFAMSELAAISRKEPSLNDLKKRCDGLAQELRDAKLPVKRVEYPTRVYEGAVVVYEDTNWVISLQVPSMSATRPELTDRKSDIVKAGKTTRGNMPSVIKELKDMLRKVTASSKPKNGMKLAQDRTSRATNALPAFSGSAIRARNWLKKNFKATPLMSDIYNNKYDTSHRLDASIPIDQLSKLVAAFQAAGLSPTSLPFTRDRREVISDGVIIQFPAREKPGNKYALITLIGNKANKTSFERPLYD